MDLSLFLLAFALFWKSSHSVKCYRCTPELQGDGIQTCQHFNADSSFIVDCNRSTMCFKRETTLEISDGMKSKSEERGCAAQTINGDQRKINGKWTQVHDIYEVYQEGCTDQPSTYQRATSTVDCYCRGDLCNGAKHTTFNLVSAITTLMFWFMAR